MKQEKELFLKDLPQHEGLFEGLELNDDSDEEDNEESWLAVTETLNGQGKNQ